jgi:hypothetical protein
MQKILEEHGRATVAVVQTRQRPAEDDQLYRERLRSAFAQTNAEIAWICLTPGEHVPHVAAAALEAGLHVIAEKPWPYVSDALIELARSQGRLAGVHFEYCLLDGVKRWREAFAERGDLRFSGRFDSPAPDRIGVPALENLGCHLLAIREYAAPRSTLGAIQCGYERERSRCVWLEGAGGESEQLDFSDSDEPIIQRFIDTFEAAREAGEFEFDLAFAVRVADAQRSLTPQ